MSSIVYRSILLLFALIAAHQMPAIGQHKAWRQYTLDDGLPSMNVWSIIQSKDDMIWFTSSKGIFSFDGYEFHEPIDTSVNRGTEAFFPTEDPSGRIWFSRLDRTVWYIDQDTVREWEFNHALATIRDDILLIYQIAFDKNGDVWLHAGQLGFVVVNAKGEMRTIRGSDTFNFLFGNVGSKLIFGVQTDISLSPLRLKAVSQIIRLEKGKMELIGNAEFKKSTDYDFLNASTVDEKKVVIKHDQDIFMWDGNMLNHLVTVDMPRSRLIASEWSQFVLTCDDEQNAGLYYFPSREELAKNQKVNILPGIRTNFALFDHTGGLWVTTRNEGLYYCKNPWIEVYDMAPSSTSKDVYRLAFDNENNLYAGVGTQTVRLDLSSHEVLPISLPGLVKQWSALYYDQRTKSLWAGSTLSVFKAGQWKPINYRLSATSPLQPVYLKSISVSPDSNRLWMSSTFGFFEMERATMYAKQHARDTLSLTSNRTFDVLEDNRGRIWVATIQGLKIYKNNQFIPPPFIHEALRYDASSLLLLEDGSVVIGTIGGGILIYHDQKPIVHLTRDQGLTTNYITSLRLRNDSTFLACTDAGLNIIKLSKDRNYNVQRVSKLNGLPSDLIHDVVAIHNDLWIGSDKGLVHWTSELSAIKIPQPEITSFFVDQSEAQLQGDLVFPYHQNHVAITFHTTHFRSDGKVQYRYRLLDSDTTFQLTTSRTVSFPELAPGSYTFEVQSQDEDGQWSKSTIQQFIIRPPWWKTGWFISLAIAGFALGTYRIIRNRNRSFREKTEVALKMKDLEMAALRAQINPHFIFNCLGSIQQFIAENDSASATRYLARFAKLVRLALHSSIDGKHSLADEIAMLDNYLALEQMRFKGKFHYQIDTSAIGDLEDIHIPPMLLQPFVENAVKHGIGQINGDGEIKITFSKKDNLLLAVIVDNGPGFSTKSAESNEDHKSVGLSLTSNRLDLLFGSDEGSNYTQENITGLDREVLGARVTIQMPLG